MTRQTRSSDVCGTIDAFQQFMADDYERLAADPETHVAPILDDSLSMIERMHVRLEEYEAFRVRLREIIETLEAIGSVSVAPAHEAADGLRRAAASPDAWRAEDRAHLSAEAERIRDVAQTHENTLRRYKDLALRMHDLFEEIRGGRSWIGGEGNDATFAGAARRRWQAWLPPEPHGTALVGWLRRDRARVLPEPGPHGEPLVEFEDGGAMRMSQVRLHPDAAGRLIRSDD